jgi:hypothetical protein
MTDRPIMESPMTTAPKARAPQKSKADRLPHRSRRVERRAAKAAAEAIDVVVSATVTEAAAPSLPRGKLGAIVALMRRPEGATVAQMSEATDWLPHSVRGALAGALKRKHGLTITSDKTDAGRVYRIAEADAGVAP